MKPLSLEEVGLKLEMKNNCLKCGKYKDEKAKDKFKMLCHLEDFEIEYWSLQQENKQLRDNWNKLKEYAKENMYYYSGYQNEDLEIDYAIQGVLNKMKELEGSDSDE